MKMTVEEVARLADYTDRQIRNLCASGALKATLAHTGYGRKGYRIEKADYLAWLACPPVTRRRWRGKRGMRGDK